MTTKLTVQDLLAKAQEVAKDPYRFAALADDPHRFQVEVLGWIPWQKQVDVMEAVRDNRRVAVRSGHGTGKTRTAAGVVLWWLYARQGLVVTTAPTKEHVEDVLWREINELAARSRVKLPGEITAVRHKITETWYADGITTNKPGAFQGRHHPRLLIVIDEAATVDELIHIEASTLATGDENCIFLIGNPTTTSGTFYEAFHKRGPWKLIHISCFDHPNVVGNKEIVKGAVTRTWVEEQRTKYGENSPFWFARVLGDFPKISNRGVIPLAWVERAQNNIKWKEALASAEDERIPLVAGLDVARYGDNRTVMVLRRGDAIVEILAWSGKNLMETVNVVSGIIKSRSIQLTVVDASGIGAGVLDRLLEMGQPVMGYNGGHRAFTPSTFTNRRTEMWWALRQRFEKERIWLTKDVPDELQSDLIAPQYAINPSGKIQLETKEQLLDRGIPSPDYADALVMCFAMDEDPLELDQPLQDYGKDPNEVFIEIKDDAQFSQLPYGF